LALTVPLFAGGANLSRIREASSVDRQSALEKRRVRRLAEQDIRTVYNRAVSDSAQAGALTTATALAERSYQEQTKDYRLGLVTNVDVLQALASALESRRALNRATFTLRSDLIVLDAASGRRNP
jgi:outer membrane protein